MCDTAFDAVNMLRRRAPTTGDGDTLTHARLDPNSTQYARRFKPFSALLEMEFLKRLMPLCELLQ